MFQKRIILYILVAIFSGGIGYLVFLKWSEQPLLKETFSPSTLIVQKQSAVKSMVHLYFINKENTFLVAEKKEILHTGDPVNFAKIVVAELIEGPKELMRTLPAGTELRALFIDQSKTAYVDFSSSVQSNHPGGIQSELFTIYSIVNSLVLNSPEIDKVKILIAGNESITLAGHIDIRFPFKANMLLVR